MVEVFKTEVYEQVKIYFIARKMLKKRLDNGQ